MGDGTAAAKHFKYLSKLNIFAGGPVQGSGVLAPAQRSLANGAWPHIRIVSGRRDLLDVGRIVRLSTHADGLANQARD
jgi:hypothetical protein